MRFIFNIIFLFVFQFSFAQLTCESIRELGVVYKGTTHRNGRTRLFPTDTAICNRMQYYTFELKLAKNLSQEDKTELTKYKIKFNPNDTVMIYDWDIMHKGKMGYHGKAIAKVRVNCTDSIITLQKYLLNKETTNDIQGRFKIFKINEKDFMMFDRIHPYLNINMYFTKD